MNLYDCHGGPGTTEPACGACVTCLHRVIEQKDQRIKRLEEAGDAMAMSPCCCVCDGPCEHVPLVESWNAAKEAKP